MQLKYDLDVRALYIRLSDNAVARTVEAGDNASVDLDDSAGVVGIEVVSVQHPWPLADILQDFPVSDDDVAQLRAYFDSDASGWAVSPEVDAISARASLASA